MLLFVGLGNPGATYARHRHNFGFMAVGAVARAHKAERWRERFHAAITEASPGGVRALLMLPQTFMNDSGRAVSGRHALLQGRACRRDRLSRRARSGARQAAREAGRRQCRPQRPALHHRPLRQRLQARAHRHRASRRQGSRLPVRAERFPQGRGALGRGHVPRHRRAGAAVGGRRGCELPEQGAPRHAGGRLGQERQDDKNDEPEND